jgi:hypothetical protein
VPTDHEPHLELIQRAIGLKIHLKDSLEIEQRFHEFLQLHRLVTVLAFQAGPLTAYFKRAERRGVS